MLCLGRPRLALGIVVRPLVERDDPLPGLVDHLLAELDGLGQDDLFFRGQESDLADLLEVHPDRVVDPDHVGAEGLELLGCRLFELDRVELGGSIERNGGALAVLAHDLDTQIGSFGEGVRRGHQEIVVVVLVLIDFDGRHGDAIGPHRRELGSLQIVLGAPRAGQDGLHEQLVGGIGHGHASTGRASRLVCSSRRSSERRASLYWRSWSSRRPIAEMSPRRSASACSARL